jgi:hypothetical protein
MQDDNVDVRYEIKVALFWRKLIGDSEYVRHDAKDLFRWYEALELAGPDDIRELFHRRQTSSRPMPYVQGLVGRAPHPPAHLVRAWLEQYETEVHTAPYWYGLAVFTTLTFMTGIYLNGLQNLQPLNPLLMNPPQAQSVVMQYPTPPPVSPNMPVQNNPQAPVMQLPSLPAPQTPNLVSTIPILSQLPLSTVRNSPLQQAPQSRAPTAH